MQRYLYVLKAALFTIAKMWKQQKSPLTYKVVCPHMEHCSDLKSKEDLAQAAVWINLEDVFLREISQSQDYCMIPPTEGLSELELIATESVPAVFSNCEFDLFVKNSLRVSSN